jgi:uncharacterized membrane protein
MKPQIAFMISGIVIGMLYVGIGIPLALGRISPNKIYGMRTAKTLSDPAIWYRANTFTGKWIIVAGIITFFSALLIPFAASMLNVRIAGIAGIALAFEVVPIIAVAIASAIFVQKL